ncbi:hypothetical protein C0389_02525 [bacterium]|nr:hypothetical protein [bacterium]
MKHKPLYIITSIISFAFSGCLRTYYPVVYESSAIPMIFDYNDSTKESNKYYSADVTITKGSYKNESLQLLRGSYTIVDTRDYVNFNSRLFGYTGIYHVAGLENYDGAKSVFGLGGEFGANLNFKIHSLKIGLGITGGVASEFGGYYNFRKKADREGRISSEQGLIFFTFSAFPVIAYEFSQSLILSAQVNLGIPGFLSPSIVLNNSGYVYWLSWVPDFDDRENYFGRRIVMGFMMNVNMF